MKTGLAIGQHGELAWTVGPEHAIYLGAAHSAGGAVVFSTPAMILLMELAARAALEPFLEEGEESVGVRVQVEHLAATPIAAIVRARATVTAIDGRAIDFEITSHDDAELIGRGTHRRAVVRMERVVRQLSDKLPALSQGVLLPMGITPNTADLPPLETMQVRHEGPLLVVTLDRPQQLNAVNARMTEDWEQLVGWLAGHPEQVRVVIVTGAGQAFCAGDDVKEVATLTPEQARHLSFRQAQMYLAFEQLPQVLIAAVNGHALGAGCVCAYSCDFRLAAHSATFGMPEILLGWPPGYGVAQLTALVGKARALELCLTGKQIKAQEAVDIGLAHEVVPLPRLLPAARELAAQLLATPAAALRETKRLIHADEGQQPKLGYLADTAAYIRCLETADAREGMAAFIAKRPPQFRGK